MRTVLLLLVMLPFLAVGCGDTTVTEKVEKAPEEVKLAFVDAASLETTLADNAVTLVDFTAKW